MIGYTARAKKALPPRPKRRGFTRKMMKRTLVPLILFSTAMFASSSTLFAQPTQQQSGIPGVDFPSSNNQPPPRPSVARGPQGSFMQEAVSKLDLTDAQKAKFEISRIADEKVHAATLAAMELRQIAERKWGELFAVLSPEQREKVDTYVKAKRDEMMARFPGAGTNGVSPPTRLAPGVSTIPDPGTQITQPPAVTSLPAPAPK